MVTLHEEIRTILLDRARAMTTEELAADVNRRGYYRKRDGSAVSVFQIHGRTRKYPGIFCRDGNLVSLIEWNVGRPATNREPHRLAQRHGRTTSRVAFTSAVETHQRPASTTAGLPSVGHTDARVLVLGSFPGAESLRKRQYYANPRNLFWRIVFEAFALPVPHTYEERLAALIRQRVALWDVLKACDRRGSLDANIESGSELPNDLLGFLHEHREVHTVALNGGTAFRLFQRFVAPHVGDLNRVIGVQQMPSTSPANTASFEAKLIRWKMTLNP